MDAMLRSEGGTYYNELEENLASIAAGTWSPRTSEFIDPMVDCIVEMFEELSNEVDAGDLLNGTTGGGTFNDNEENGLPAYWWKDQSGSAEESQRLNQLLGSLPRDIQNGMTNIKVVMDSETVGYLVAPVVSQQIARNAG